MSQPPPRPSLLPSDACAPVFAEPWQAQAFAMTLQLHQRGLFSWPEWAAALAARISAAQAAGYADLGGHQVLQRCQPVLVVGVAQIGVARGLRRAMRAASAAAHSGQLNRPRW